MVLSTSEADGIALKLELSEKPLLVVALCAAWCGACREFRPVFERIATVQPDAAFVWLDVEDDSVIAGDIDVENFPTLAVYRNGTAVHFGISLPHEAVIARLVKALAEGARPIAVGDAVADLPNLLREHARLQASKAATNSRALNG